MVWISMVSVGKDCRLFQEVALWQLVTSSYKVRREEV